MTGLLGKITPRIAVLGSYLGEMWQIELAESSNIRYTVINCGTKWVEVERRVTRRFAD